MATDTDVVRLPYIQIGIYEPDYRSFAAKWKRERGWETMPVPPPLDADALAQYHQERANTITRQLREMPLAAVADKPWLKTGGVQ